jgi:hypothetical protein
VVVDVNAFQLGFDQPDVWDAPDSILFQLLQHGIEAASGELISTISKGGDAGTASGAAPSHIEMSGIR